MIFLNFFKKFCIFFLLSYIFLTWNFVSRFLDLKFLKKIRVLSPVEFFSYKVEFFGSKNFQFYIRNI